VRDRVNRVLKNRGLQFIGSDSGEGLKIRVHIHILGNYLRQLLATNLNASKKQFRLKLVQARRKGALRAKTSSRAGHNARFYRPRKVTDKGWAARCGTRRRPPPCAPGCEFAFEKMTH